jgi:hypothetical protein
VLTKKLAAFSNVNDDVVIDMIPLHEIASVRDMTIQHEIAEMDESDGNESASNDDSSEMNDNIKNVLQIETSPIGYNSGRVYQIRAALAEIFSPLLESLVKLSSAAREEAEKKSRFRKSQDRVGRVFNSDTMQRVLAALIFAVSHRVHICPNHQSSWPFSEIISLALESQRSPSPGTQHVATQIPSPETSSHLRAMSLPR